MSKQNYNLSRKPKMLKDLDTTASLVKNSVIAIPLTPPVSLLTNLPNPALEAQFLIIIQAAAAKRFDEGLQVVEKEVSPERVG